MTTTRTPHGHPIRRRRIRRVAALLGAGIVMSVLPAQLLAPVAGAQEALPDSAQGGTPDQPVVDATTDQLEQPVLAATDWAKLHARAAADGGVKVVVELDPALRSRSRDEHRRNLNRSRDRLRGEFSGVQMKDFRSLDGSPIVSFTATTQDLTRLQRSKAVRNVTIDEVHESAATVTHGSQAGVQLKNWWNYTQVGADWANNNGYTGRGQTIAVIDSGVDRYHGWLNGWVVNEACFATNVNGTGACPGGKTALYNATSAGVTGAATPCTYSFSCAHGTHVAHTASGRYGTARSAGIVAIQASHPEQRMINGTLQWVPLYNTSDLINALWYVHSVLPFRPAAVNLSIGGGGETAACDAKVPTVTSYINALKTKGIATVIASGNDDYMNAVAWPGCISSAITVGNTTLTTAGVDAVLGYTGLGKGGSNSSAQIDLLAPGTDICSAVPATLDSDGTKDGIDCGYYGTSMATPHVSGAIAQLRQSRPTATIDQIQSALQRRGVGVQDSRNGLVRTRINVANAIYWF